MTKDFEVLEQMAPVFLWRTELMLSSVHSAGGFGLVCSEIHFPPVQCPSAQQNRKQSPVPKLWI